jgi:hypothetical protein
MSNKYLYSLVLVTLVFGFLCVGQVNAQSNDIAGVWVANIDDIIQVGKELEMTFRNQNFELKLDGVPFTRGICIASDGHYLTQTTAVYGTVFQLDKKWYTQDQLKTALKASFTTIMTLEQFNELIDSMFLQEMGTYTVKDKVLTMKKDGEAQSLTYTLKMK